MQLQYQWIDYLSTAAQVKINLTLLQYRTAVVGAEIAIWALQLNTMQLQWTMNAALFWPPWKVQHFQDKIILKN